MSMQHISLFYPGRLSCASGRIKRIQRTHQVSRKQNKTGEETSQFSTLRMQFFLKKQSSNTYQSKMNSDPFIRIMFSNNEGIICAVRSLSLYLLYVRFDLKYFCFTNVLNINKNTIYTDFLIKRIQSSFMLAVCLQADFFFPLQICSVKMVRQIVSANIFELWIIYQSSIARYLLQPVKSQGYT